MPNRTMKQIAAVIAIACVGAIAATAASAYTEVTTSPPDDDPRFGGPGAVRIEGDASANRIQVRFNRKRRAFVIRDSAAEVRTSECARLTLHRVRCRVRPVDEYEISAFPQDGDDSVEIVMDVRTSALIGGGEGDDVLKGGRGPDSLFGSFGNDRLRGGPRDDNVSGDQDHDVERGGRGDDFLGSADRGIDSFFGGRGSDVLDTSDDIVDRRIRCGRGENDLAFIDEPERFRVKRCPRIEVSPF